MDGWTMVTYEEGLNSGSWEEKRGERMASRDQSYKAGETKSQAQEKRDEMMEKAREATHAMKVKASESTQSGRDTAQVGHEKTGSFLQQGKQQMKNMAQGVTNAVKNTFGMADVGDDNNTIKEK
ncbi:late embryogenesis abundant protein Dc3-like [Magnolia sinica]|uniref:late embryogenesis abundant protein Dc3-like n=1 Tax=Magnolia sinica TaxID=86752 RepID=UPI002659D12B|nr:late embryogenesis abundant protein Dc3-like [Magnolia sinica]